MTSPKKPAVFLVGEGVHDIGDLAEHQSYRSGRDGFTQPIIRKVLGQGTTFDGRKIAILPREKLADAKGAMQRKAAMALSLAAASNCSVLVLVSDLDRTSGVAASRTERQKRWKQRLSEIQAGFSAARDRSPELEGTRAIPAIPCRMIEAWALGDSEAVKVVADGQLGCEWRSPEELWGREADSSSEHPKCVLDRALGRRHSAADLAAIASESRLDTLEFRCPDSFAPFLRALSQTVTSED
jgi:hypothetical protein